jgi:hypothetical protein
MSEKKNNNKSAKEVKDTGAWWDPKHKQVEATRRKKHSSIQLRYIVLACSLACSESMGVDWNASAILLHGAVERGDGEFSHPGDQKKKGLSRHIYTIALNQAI